jgi:hypothetical protein
MVRLALMVACGALVVGTAAQAQVSVTASSASTGWNNDDGIYMGAGHIDPGTGPTTSYSSIVTNDGKSVTFTSGNSVLGQVADTQSFSSVDFRVTNPTGVIQLARLGSEITAAGMGFYIADTRGGCMPNPALCPQIGSAAAGGPPLIHTFNDFTSGNGGDKASASFDFDVVSNHQTLLHLGGTMFLNSDGVVEDEGLQAAFRFLDVSRESLGNADSGEIRTWGAKEIGPFDLGALLGGQGADISYNITVSSMMNTTCLGDGACLVA